jgi:KGK domain
VEKKAIILDDYDVVYFTEKNNSLQELLTFVIRLIAKGGEVSIQVNKPHPLAKLFSKDGASCIVLQPGESWKIGTLKFRLEFVPDEAKEDEQKEEIIEISPLDDLREKFKQST